MAKFIESAKFKAKEEVKSNFSLLPKQAFSPFSFVLHDHKGKFPLLENGYWVRKDGETETVNQGSWNRERTINNSSSYSGELK
ncbi:hypothetical protein [Methylomicrobium lacus]|uniref:hypothetical protein n=1 Tax=Methylomicrobium lacus TaxID=136992 RepID=UPI0035A89CB2